MKRVMRRRFIPSSYRRDLRNRLQTLKQGCKSVDEYFKEVELLLIQSDIKEDEESRMARFLHGLNDDISSFVRCFHIKLCKILLIKTCAPRGKFSKKDVDGPMRVDLSQLHGAGSSPVHMLVVFDLKVLQLGPLHPLVLQRQYSLVLLHMQISKKIVVLLQVQQLLQLHQPLHHLRIAEALFVTSAKAVGTFLLSVLVKGLCFLMSKVNGNLKVMKTVLQYMMKKLGMMRLRFNMMKVIIVALFLNVCLVSLL
jgi:hypothetical protein